MQCEREHVGFMYNLIAQNERSFPSAGGGEPAIRRGMAMMRLKENRRRIAVCMHRFPDRAQTQYRMHKRNFFPSASGVFSSGRGMPKLTQSTKYERIVAETVCRALNA